MENRGLFFAKKLWKYKVGGGIFGTLPIKSPIATTNLKVLMLKM
jgi:hypothetical protein